MGHAIAPATNVCFAKMLEDFRRGERESRRMQNYVLLMHAISLAGPVVGLALALRFKRKHT